VDDDTVDGDRADRDGCRVHTDENRDGRAVSVRPIVLCVNMPARAECGEQPQRQ